MAKPPRAKMSGPELVGRMVANEAALITLAKMVFRDPDTPSINFDSFRASMIEEVDNIADGIGHPEAAEAAKLSIDDLLAAMKDGAPPAPK